MSAAAPVSLLMRVRRVWDRLAVYLPLLLMGVMAMSTYWAGAQYARHGRCRT